MVMVNKNPNLGKQATDLVTGFSGIITGFCQYLTGCNQYLVVPKTKDESKYPDGSWLDENRLKIGEEVINTSFSPSVGCDKEAPKY